MFSKMIMLLLLSFGFLEACQTRATKKAPPVPEEASSVAAAPNALPRTIVVGLDGIGYPTYRKALKQGMFAQFQSPGKMLSLFPTVSDPNWNAIFALPPALGFTKNTFDPKADEGKGAVVGSILSHLTDHPEYEKRFDHHKISVVEVATNLAWLETSLEIWIQDFSLKLLESRGRSTFFAFTLNIDLISHTQGETAALQWLQRIDRELRGVERIYQERGLPRPEIVLISDHGNSYYEKVELIDAISHLEARGWKRAENLEQETDFVFVAPEILSVAGFWTKKEKAFAIDIAEAPGVLFSVFKSSPEQLEVRSSRLKANFFLLKKGIARFQKDLASIGLDSPLDQQRLWEAFELSAQEPPTVIAASQKAWAFSNPFLKVITGVKGLKSLHGALFTSESEGIFVSNRRKFPDIRPWEFQKFIDLKEFQPRAQGPFPKRSLYSAQAE